jgi:hypothetical protein
VFTLTETVATGKQIVQTYQGAIRHSTIPQMVDKTIQISEDAYLEIYRNGSTGQLFVVNQPDLGNSELSGGNANAVYQSWCTPFVPGSYPGISCIEPNAVYGEHIHVDPTKYGLPRVLERWPQIMDDEVWSIWRYSKPSDKTIQQQVLNDYYELF